MLMKEFSEADLNDFASLWKSKGKLLKRLEDAVIYQATVEHVESKREKELVKMVARMQNELLEGFFLQRSDKTFKNTV